MAASGKIQRGLEVYSHASPFEDLRARLAGHLPYSLPLLRRLQTAAKLGANPAPEVPAFVLATVPPASKHPTSDPCADVSQAKDEHFAACYARQAPGPGTQAWLFSCLELPASTHAINGECNEHVLATLKSLGQSICRGSDGDKVLLIGSLHGAILSCLPEASLRRKNGPYGKYIFTSSMFPRVTCPIKREGEDECRQLDGEFFFRSVRDAELALVQSRSSIPRTTATLASFPSMAAVPNPRHDHTHHHHQYAETPIGLRTAVSWAFLDSTASLISLHTEPLFRRRGLGRQVALRLLQDFFEQEEDEQGEGNGYAQADVDHGNVASGRLCESLGGERAWDVWWVWVDLRLL